MVLSIAGNAQRYNFTNFGVEDGLVQSQPLDIVQDKYGSLWVATLGGISRYDGNSFHNYTESEGLTSHLAYKLYAAKNGHIYIGNEDGLESFDGRKFTGYPWPASVPGRPVINITEDNKGAIFLLTDDAKLFIQQSGKIQPVTILPGKIFVTTILADSRNTVYAAVYKNGIYKWDGSSWQLFIDLKAYGPLIIKKLFIDRDNNLWLLTNTNLYVYSNGKLTKVELHNNIKSAFTTIGQDSKGHIWLGTNKGAYLLNAEGMPAYVGASAGLTDITINNIMNDREGNLWFTTDGDGLFRLNNTPFYMLDKTAGLSGNMVMGLLFKNNALWAGTADGGVVKQQGGTFTKVNIPSPHPEAQKINTLVMDAKQQIWAGSIGGGLWKTADDKNFAQVFTDDGHPFNYATCVYEDSSKKIWAIAPTGVYYYTGKALHKMPGFDEACFSVFDAGNNTLLAGTVNGLWQIKDSAIGKVNIPGTVLHSVNCFARAGDYILLGTGDKGIICWNPKSNTVIPCSQQNGLPSNFIFSLYVDTGNTIYAGTGHGISKIKFNENKGAFTVKNYSFSNTVYGPECNLNAIKKNDDGTIWVGTTKGIIVYNPASHDVSNETPLVFLDAVKLFSKNIPPQVNADTVIAWSAVPKDLSLSYTQNHITFEFLGVYLTNPAGLKYRYKLEGNDTGYSEAVTVPKVIYSNLAPGNYRFKAFAVADNGMQSGNSINFPFTIETPFFKRTWFTVLVVLLLIGAGVLVQYLRTRMKARRAAILKQLRLEEQLRIQQRTSEDLHDDLGNKISRITVLADVLYNKMDKADEDKIRLVKQIKENAQSLYLGTKDIIWSLTPGNDNLYDVLERCYNFGSNLFEDTDIAFKMEGQDDSFKKVILPVIINRNMVMIIKEALNNILKHAAAANACLQVNLDGERRLSIIIADDGKGINGTAVRQGNGLGNIQKRVERVGGQLSVSGNQPQGTVVTTTFKIPPNEG